MGGFGVGGTKNAWQTAPTSGGLHYVTKRAWLTLTVGGATSKRRGKKGGGGMGAERPRGRNLGKPSPNRVRGTRRGQRTIQEIELLLAGGRAERKREVRALWSSRTRGGGKGNASTRKFVSTENINNEDLRQLKMGGEDKVCHPQRPSLAGKNEGGTRDTGMEEKSAWGRSGRQH